MKEKNKSGFVKNRTVDLEITDFTTEGEGVGHTDDCTFFVKDALIGDVVTVIITKVKKTYAYARIKDIIVPSPYRVKPPCPDAQRCGGCQIQALSYNKQLEFKQSKVINNIIRIGGFEKEYIEGIAEPIAGMGNNYFRYRNKAQYPIGRDKDGKLIAGFFAGRTHSIIPLDDCLIGIPENKPILDTIIKWMRDFGIEPYDEVSHKGIVRHVLIRKGFATGELMVCLVINADTLIHKDELISALGSVDFSEKLPESRITNISYSVNKNDTNVIMGDGYVTVYGSDTITDFIGDLKFSISPLSFYQVNPVQTKKLYEKALEYADLTGNEIVWDLYCGIGTISLFMAQRAKQVYGVEIIPQAIEDARKNAELNGITNATFFIGKAEDIVSRAYEASLMTLPDNALHPDVIVVDPPRKGCDELCLDTILKMSPKRIVYVSCDSATLARDLKILCAGGYTVTRLAPVDMFPNTVHVETVALLSKLSEAKHHIEVTVDMDELDLTRAESKATYREIQDWVQEHYGFHVTNLNIAQVKQKHRIIERENYNKAKSENSKQPGCPEEKVKAIEDAMRHFQMI